jgi:hypothetical protein
VVPTARIWTIPLSPKRSPAARGRPKQSDRPGVAGRVTAFSALDAQSRRDRAAVVDECDCPDSAQRTLEIERKDEPAVRSGASGGPEPAACYRIEELSALIRLIARQAFGFHSPAPLIALAMLKLAGLCPPLPR